MKVTQMKSPRSGNAVANQFIIKDGHIKYFQSYDSIIVKIENPDTAHPIVTLDQKYWNYSVTTSKYRNIFLGENYAETAKKINDGTYKLADLN